MTTTETVADVATNIRRSVEYIEKKYPGAKTLDAAIILRNMKRWASQIESALASAEPVACVAEVHMSRYTIEWIGAPLPKGSPLYGYAPSVCWQHRPGSLCPTPASCRSNGCSAVERELFPDTAQPAVPVESLGRDAGPSFDDVCRTIRAYGLACIDLGMEGMRPSSETPASVPGGWRDHGNSALAHISNALDDLDSSPDQRPVPLLNEAMFHIREMLSPTNQEGAAP